jgi:O-antigen/teichoic acid export membrane protein
MKTEFFYRKTGLISLGTLLSAIINITLNIIFVPKFGYIAAAITTTISYLFLFIFHYLITSNLP